MEHIFTEKSSSEMDPRRKDSQGLDYWAANLLKSGLITQGEYDDFLDKNNSKEKQMEEKHLPQLKHYGTFNSIQDIQERIKIKEGERLIIRCTSKKDGSIKRLLDTDITGACDFAEQLPGGFDEWSIEVKEFVKTKAAGTITVSPDGATYIEMWHGAHYLNTTNSPKYVGRFDPNVFDMRYNWFTPEGAEDTEKMQYYAFKALKYYYNYHFKPKAGEPIYMEFGIKEDGEVYFIEANDSPVVTGGY